MRIELKIVENAARNMLGFLDKNNILSIKDLKTLEGKNYVGDDGYWDCVNVRAHTKEFFTLSYSPRGVYSRAETPLRVDLKDGEKNNARFVVKFYGQIKGYEPKSRNVVDNDIIWVRKINDASLDMVREELRTLIGAVQIPPSIFPSLTNVAYD